MTQSDPKKIEISPRTILFTVLLLIGIYFIFSIIDIIILLVIALIFTAAINPLVVQLEKYKIPRGVSISIVYVLIFGLIVAALATIIPPLVAQLSSLITQVTLPPTLKDDIIHFNVTLQDIETLTNQLSSVPRVLGFISSAFSGVVVFFTVSVMSFYMLLERRDLPKYLKQLFPKDKAETEAEIFVNKLEDQIGSWVRGELVLMFIVGTLTFIGLKLLGINYALPLAILAGVLELLPNIGPTLAAIPAVIVAYLSVSGPMALVVMALYILVQQLENNFIVPFVMRKSVGLNPVMTILILLIGLKLGGALGAVLAIPIFLLIKVVAVETYKLKTGKNLPLVTETKSEPGNE